MPAATVRDVIFRAKIEFQNDRPFDKAKSSSDAFKRETDRLNKTIRDTGRTVDEVARKEEQRHRRASRGLDERIRKVRELNREQKKGGGVRGGLVNAAAGAVVGGAALSVLSQAPDLISGLAADFEGGRAAREEGLITRWSTEFNESVNRFSSAVSAFTGLNVPGLVGPEQRLQRGAFADPAAARRLGISDLDIGLANSTGRGVKPGADARLSAARELLAAQEEQLAGVREIRQLRARLHEGEIAAATKVLGLAQKRLVVAERELALFKGEQTTFAGLNADERQQAVAVAQKIGKDGFGSLSERETEFARSSGLFGTAQQTAANDPALKAQFRDLLKASGEIDRFETAERQQRQAKDFIELNQQVINEVRVQVEGIDGLADEVEAKVRPLMENLVGALEKKIRENIARQNIPDF